jgi:hypothetical protein
VSGMVLPIEVQSALKKYRLYNKLNYFLDIGPAPVLFFRN